MPIGGKGGGYNIEEQPIGTKNSAKMTEEQPISASTPAKKPVLSERPKKVVKPPPKDLAEEAPIGGGSGATKND